MTDAPVSARASGAAGKPQYRPDVDGLRAIAILAVLGFHAFPDWVPGGFIGVDVFFVISGFLITGILLDGLEKGSLSLETFYARRVRRIFPGLVLVTFVSAVVGWFVLLPDEYEQLGKHIAAGLAFVSNLALWREAGYFDSSSETKPLLHLWSLGVEEQFYLIWPLFLAGLRRAGLGRSSWPIALLGSSSLVLGLFLQTHNPVAAFYLPFARFWELSAGALLSFLRHELPISRSGPRSWFDSSVGNGVSLLGLGLVVATSFRLHPSDPFPGWRALIPAAGAVLMILGHGSWVNRRILASRLLVYVGLISYPLYLWHWPLLSMTRISLGQFPSPDVRLALVALAFLAADLTRRLIEKPFRTGLWGIRPLVASALLVLSGGIAIRQSSGVVLRFGPDQPVSDFTNFTRWGIPPTARTPPCVSGAVDGQEMKCSAETLGRPGAALLGDSHALHLLAGLATLDQSRTWTPYVVAACPPLTGVVATTPECKTQFDQLLSRLLAGPAVSIVILSFHSAYLGEPRVVAQRTVNTDPGAAPSPALPHESRKEVFLSGLEATVSRLENRGIRVVLVLDTPALPFLPRDCVRRRLLGFGGQDRVCVLPTEVVRRQQRAYREVIDEFQRRHPGVRAFDPIPILCPDETCRYQDNSGVLFRDGNHLSVRGSNLLAKSLLAWDGLPEASAEPPH